MKKLSVLMLFSGMFFMAACNGQQPQISSQIPSISSSEESSITSEESSSSEISSSSISSIPFTWQKLESYQTYHDVGYSNGMRYLQAIGDVNLLVIPIHIDDQYSADMNEQVHEGIEKGFFGEADETGWESVSSYYSKSSYGRLDIQGTVAPWYDSGLSISEVNKSNIEDLTLAALEDYKEKNNTDCSEFDLDGDGFLDAVWFIYDIPDYYTYYYYSQGTNIGDTYWAFTSWQLDNEADVDSPTICSYAWASYTFLYEGYGRNVDAHTLIHETGHLMGLDDYYDYSGSSSPAGALDMMDNNICDHNAFSKFALGWVEPYLVDQKGELRIRPFESSGDCVVIPTDGTYNESAFDEYLILEYYTPTGLNKKDSVDGPYPGNGLQGFTESGVKIYHVDSRLISATRQLLQIQYTPTVVDTPTRCTYVSHSNTESRTYHEKEWRLLQLMDCAKKRDFTAMNKAADNTSLFYENDYFTLDAYENCFHNDGYFNNGDGLDYDISFVDMDETGVTVVIE
ncbi:MAG: hypothetical protein K5694_05860 [Bacilli bacterium]|nr:hypothetical protein [Bacilli bacterium]